jgi:hypothetical protein
MSLNLSFLNKLDVDQHAIELYRACKVVGFREFVDELRRFVRTFTTPGSAIRKRLMQHIADIEEKGGSESQGENAK